ncbi:hypothetical protein ACE7GA_00400 [Roseomonas sp. CCTCC AB2023176]|uniref:hypothetical protein n=1 Tax=Roseomonas sp. CCTCC AB2023176 TaxID=3342640 RepID=UPI0035E14819
MRDEATDDFRHRRPLVREVRRVDLLHDPVDDELLLGGRAETFGTHPVWAAGVVG